MIQKILRSDNPKLRQKSKKVKKIDKKTKELIADLKQTLKAQSDPEGVGLAAPQIGKFVRVFVMNDGNEIKTVINPEILSIEDKTNHKTNIMEGCLSIPHYYGPLIRSEKVTIKYMNESGDIVEETFEDFPAQIVQHEIDHLNGVLFVDRLLEEKQPLYKYDSETEEWEEVDFAKI